MNRLVLIALAVCIVGSFAGRTPLDPNVSSRIIGGQVVLEDGAHPYIVSLRFNGKHKCSATILSKDYIITAAHCVYGEQGFPTKFSVVAGSNKLSTTTAIDVETITPHAEYAESTLLNDIALLKVIGLTLGDKISQIETETEAVEEIEATLTGWGSTRAGGEFSEDLKEISLKTISLNACQEVYGNRTVTNKQICTSTEANTNGFCYGDSGSPLVREVEVADETVTKLVGIASWGTPCARGSPDVFLKVSSYNDWINNIVNPAPQE